MKILWLSHLIPYPPKGGVLQRSYYLLKEIAWYHDVDLLAFNQKKIFCQIFASVKSGMDESKKVLGNICHQLAFFDIESDSHAFGPHLLALKSLFFDPYNINWLKSKKFSFSMKEWIDQNDYDLIHFDTISLIPYVNLAPSSIATSLDHHNIESHMLKRRARKEKNIIKKFYYWQEGVRLERYERRYCPQFSINITCSNLDSDRLQNLAPEAKVSVIPNSVDTDFFKPTGRLNDINSIIFVGSMSWYPNIQAVLYIADKIWPRLQHMHQNLQIHIIGASPPESIRTLASKHVGFHVHGFLDDIRPFMESATVYLCPVQDGGGTKLKILDAMAMGKAVVAHPIACEGINVAHQVNVLLADSPTMFINYVDLLIRNSEKRKMLEVEARKLIENEYDYRIIGKKLSDSFEDCIQLKERLF
jgi:glycosyltransferase involved in cell wall biosynthesis